MEREDQRPSRLRFELVRKDLGGHPGSSPRYRFLPWPQQQTFPRASENPSHSFICAVSASGLDIRGKSGERGHMDLSFKRYFHGRR